MKMQGKWPISTAVVHRYAWVEVKSWVMTDKTFYALIWESSPSDFEGS